MMVLAEIFESVISMRKTVWSKRGDHISKKHIDKMIATDIQPKRYIEIKKDQKENG